MKRLAAIAALSLFGSVVSAAPFMVSDPWPLTDAAGVELLQPDSCQSVEGAATPKSVTLLTNAAGQKYIKQDLAGTTNGAHTLVITCKNSLWGVASAPVNFQFVAGAPTVPAGLRVAP